MCEDAAWYDFEMSWQARLARWLAVSEWSRKTAAYLLVGLDPEGTHGPCDKYGVIPDWVTHHGRDALPAGEVASNHELDMLLTRALEETQRADRAVVATPSEWLEWSVRVRLEPPWLKAASGDKRLLLLLPALPPFRDMGKEAGLLRETARAGGKQRQENSKAGQAKKLLLPLIEEWLNSSTKETAKAFAERLQQNCLGAPDPEPHARPCWAEIPTIEGWIRLERQKLKNSGRSPAS